MRSVIKSTITEEDFQFIKDHGDRRIAPQTLEAYKKNENIAFKSYKDEILTGLTAGIVLNNKAIFNITITHKDYRNTGIGTDLLRHKMLYFNQNKFEYETIVAADNGPSLAICLKNRMILEKIEDRTRASGQFKSFLLRQES